jgi:hypothetical protein
MNPKVKKRLIIGGIALFIGGVTVWEQVRPVHHHELGIELLNRDLCNEFKTKTREEGWSGEVQNHYCSESTVKLSPELEKDEQERLRDLKNSKGKIPDELWENSRDILGILMRSRRFDAEMKAEIEAKKQRGEFTLP